MVKPTCKKIDMKRRRVIQHITANKIKLRRRLIVETIRQPLLACHVLTNVNYVKTLYI